MEIKINEALNHISDTLIFSLSNIKEDVSIIVIETVITCLRHGQFMVDLTSEDVENPIIIKRENKTFIFKIYEDFPIDEDLEKYKDDKNKLWSKVRPRFTYYLHNQKDSSRFSVWYRVVDINK